MRHVRFNIDVRSLSPSQSLLWTLNPAQYYVNMQSMCPLYLLLLIHRYDMSCQSSVGCRGS